MAQRKILLNSAQIEVKIRDVIRYPLLSDYMQNGQSKPVVLIGVMTGAYPFMYNLGLALSVRHSVDFITVKSYEGKSRKESQVVSDISIDIEGKYVIIVDEYSDSGKTLEFLIKHLSKKNPFALKTCTLIYKESKTFTPNYFGVKLAKDDPRWFYGYGLDRSDGTERNTNCIYYDEEIKEGLV